MKRSLIGCIPSLSLTSGFGIPVYEDEKGAYEFHKLSKDLKSIVDFDEAPEKIDRMITLPPSLQKDDIEIGDSPFFVITTLVALFVGTADDLAIYADGIRKVVGDNFISELNLLFNLNKNNA